MKGNSGIFLQSIYEVQVLDGEDNPTYVNGMVGSIYKQQAPAANAFTGTEKWQGYDIYWKAPRFGCNGVSGYDHSGIKRYFNSEQLYFERKYSVYWFPDIQASRTFAAIVAGSWCSCCLSEYLDS